MGDSIVILHSVSPNRGLRRRNSKLSAYMICRSDSSDHPFLPTSPLPYTISVTLLVDPLILSHPVLCSSSLLWMLQQSQVLLPLVSLAPLVPKLLVCALEIWSPLLHYNPFLSTFADTPSASRSQNYLFLIPSWIISNLSSHPSSLSVHPNCMAATFFLLKWGRYSLFLILSSVQICPMPV